MRRPHGDEGRDADLPRKLELGKEPQDSELVSDLDVHRMADELRGGQGPIAAFDREP